MAGVKISELSVISSKSGLSASDKLEMLDVSDPSMGPAGTNKAVTLQALVGELLAAVPGSVVASAAVVADADGRIEGVSGSDLARLDVTPGQITAGKALVADNNGKIVGIGQEELNRLLGVPGQWEANKALVPDSSGQLAGISSTHLGRLTSEAGQLETGKAAVPDGDLRLVSSNLELDAGSSPRLLVSDESGSSLVEPGLVKAYADADNYSQISSDRIVTSAKSAVARIVQIADGEVIITDGSSTITVSLADMKVKLESSGGVSELTNSQLTIASGTSEIVLTASSIIVSTSSSNIKFLGLPTSDPGQPGRLWVDGSGYLRVSL